MTIDGNTNNVGIGLGTTTPAHTLELVSPGIDVARVGSTGADARSLVDTAIANSLSFSGDQFQIGHTAKWFNGAFQTSGSNYDYSIFNYQVGGSVFTIDGTSNNVGIGTTAPQQQLSVNTRMDVDQANINPGTGAATGCASCIDLSFGQGSGEGIGSARIAGSPNQFGLDFYSGFTKQMELQHNGDVFLTEPDAGIIMKSAPGIFGIVHCTRYHALFDGTLQGVSVPCPN
jgi:hypothetical protein